MDPYYLILNYFLFTYFLFLIDLFLFLKDEDMCNFADDNTTFVCDESNESGLKSLEKNVEFALDWFENNCMKLNTNQ